MNCARARAINFCLAMIEPEVTSAFFPIQLSADLIRRLVSGLRKRNFYPMEGFGKRSNENRVVHILWSVITGVNERESGIN